MSGRPYRVTCRWDDGAVTRTSVATRKKAELLRADALGVAAALRDGSWLLAFSTEAEARDRARPGEEVFRDGRSWRRRRPSAAVVVTVTKKRAAAQ